ncbi:MAG: response regulator [Kofleriaceae bacterium]
MSRASSARELVGVEVLVVDQDPAVQRGIVPLLAEASLHVTCVADPEAAITRCEDQFFSVVLVDLDTPAPGAGLATVRAIKLRSPTSMIIALTPRRSYDDAVAAVRAGAIDLVLKAPESVGYLKERVLEAAGRSVGRREVDSVLADVRRVYEDFLQRFVDAERRALDLADRAAGRDPNRTVDLDELRVLIVDEVDDLFDGLTAAAPPGFTFLHATSGGEALDRATSGTSTTRWSPRTSPICRPRCWCAASRPRTRSWSCCRSSARRRTARWSWSRTAGSRPIVEPFREVGQLLERMDELATAWRAKAARAALHPGLPRAPLRLPAPIRGLRARSIAR